ncbi:pentapeptide repeat-containing protein [Nonomuraea sp. NPDC050680]|uniref:pentapeptide repeat-containing protein n=1 Tax=Nonomuraea sp. NPDC050680 TaxID=3154630 RepID=UPI0034019F53
MCPWKARLTGAGLNWTTLTRADLTNATLTHANMGFARLRSPKPANTELDGADLCGAAPKDADLRGCEPDRARRAGTP